MAWQQQSQNRHQYSMDGDSRTAWQSSHVYVPSRRKDRGLSPKQTMDIISFVLAVFAAFVAYHQVARADFAADLPSAVRYAVLGGTVVLSFITAAMITYAKFFRAVLGIGMVVFCAGVFIWPALF